MIDTSKPVNMVIGGGSSPANGTAQQAMQDGAMGVPRSVMEGSTQASQG